MQNLLTYTVVSKPFLNKKKILKEIANLAFFMKLTYKKSPPRDMV